jgi:hypothetical protein
MSINMADVKQIMHNNKEVAKIQDSLGNILWQKPVTTVTISYACLRLNQYLPASKTVQLTNNQYALTSADLPTINLGNTADQIVGWTLDGSTQLQAGNTISTNVTLRAIHKITASNKTYYSQGSNKAYQAAGSGTKTVSASTSKTVYNLKTAKTGTYTYSYTYTANNSPNNRYIGSGVALFVGQILNTQVYPGTKFKIHWSPAVGSVTYSKYDSKWVLEQNYAPTYPKILVRDGNTTTKIYVNDNVGANFVSSTITAGASANGYLTFQYGGWNSSGKGTASGAAQSSFSLSSSTTTYGPKSNVSAATDHIYLYMQP